MCNAAKDNRGSISGGMEEVVGETIILLVGNVPVRCNETQTQQKDFRSLLSIDINCQVTVSPFYGCD